MYCFGNLKWYSDGGSQCWTGTKQCCCGTIKALALAEVSHTNSTEIAADDDASVLSNSSAGEMQLPAPLALYGTSCEETCKEQGMDDSAVYGTAPFCGASCTDCQDH